MERVLKIVQPILLALWITMAAGGVVNAVDTDSNNGGFVSVFDSKLKRADRYFENFEYKTAIKLYLKLVDKGKINDHIRLRLAESYLKINDPINAEKWYAEVIHSPEITAVHQIQYAQTLLSTGKYQQAREVIDQYEFAKSDYRSEAILATLDRLDIFYEDSVNYGVNSVESNHQEFSDFSPTVFKEGIVFVSNRSKKGKKFRWDDTPFLDLYYTDGDLASARPFSNRLNSKYHEGPVAFFDDFNGIIFTRSNYYDGELGSTEEGVNNLQLYTATWNEKIQDWDQIEAFPLNIEEYSFGHPSLSDDGQRLYFVSDMPGGFGGTDVYLSNKTETGWSEPVNLGEVINTPGNEMYPQVTGDDLFFASNGHGGLGGLDLYQVDISQDQAIVRNMGYPVNTPADDFGISFLPNSDKAFISSNRQGKDNIYQVDILAEDLHQVLANNAINSNLEENVDNLEPLLATNELSTEQDLELANTDEDLVTINTAILDLESQLALEDAKLNVMVDGEVIQTTTADENGNVTLTVPAGKEYILMAKKDGFEDKEISLPAASLGQEEDILIALQPSDDEQLPELSTPQEETLAVNETQNLDPIAVEGERLVDSGIMANEKKQLTGVALLDVPEFEGEQTTSEAADTKVNQQELDPLDVEGERLVDSGLTTEDRDQLTGVALLDVPEFEEETGTPAE
ncbi:MAG: hypothetical protein OER04_19500, partial [Cyclobacteriaceae bacterium]|nr:hypothetical protein [Cyclobacteriaceae bacterium]